MRKMISLAGSCHRLMAMATSERFVGIGVQIVAEDRLDVMPPRLHSCLDDGEHLAFGDNVINVDEYRFEFARCG